VPEPVAGSVLVPLRVPVWFPMVDPVIELSLPLPPVAAPEVPVAPAPVAPLTELSVACVPVVAAGAFGSVAGFESLVFGIAAPSCPVGPVLGACVAAALPLPLVPDRDALSSAQAPSSNEAGIMAAQSQSLLVVMRCAPPVSVIAGTCERADEKRRGPKRRPSDLPETGRQTR
jgi:hypothetical protein